MCVIVSRLNKLEYNKCSCFFFPSILWRALVKASPVTIPPRPYPAQMKPMRNSVEGLNQEIEKLVLVPGQPHTCRPESNLVNVMHLFIILF